MRSSKPICFVTKSITRPSTKGARCGSMSTCNEPGARQALAATEGCRGKRRQWCPGADRQTRSTGAGTGPRSAGEVTSPHRPSPFPQPLSLLTWKWLPSYIACPQPLCPGPYWLELLQGGIWQQTQVPGRENSCGLLWVLRYDLSLHTAAQLQRLEAWRAISHSTTALLCSWRGSFVVTEMVSELPN